VVNHVLAARGTGYLVRDGINYAFAHGLSIIVPNQRRSRVTWELVEPSSAWWKEVIERETWRVLPGYEDPERRSSRAPMEVGHRPLIISVGQAAARIDAADRLRVEREKAYR
jgi:hypothetical protein